MITHEYYHAAATMSPCQKGVYGDAWYIATYKE